MRQGIGAGDGEEDVAGLLIKIHSLNQSLISSFQVAIGPGGKRQKRFGSCAAEIILLGKEVKRPAGMLQGGRYIAKRKGKIGAGRSDRSR